MKTDDGMNRRSMMKLLAFGGSAMSGSLALLARAADRGETPPAAPSGAERRHPRLFYDAGSVTALRQMLAGNPSDHEALMKSGDALLASELVSEAVAQRGGGQHANYGTPARQMAEMGLTLGLLFHLTGEKRYAEKLRDALLHYVTYDRWAGQGLKTRVPEWHSELNTATFSFGYAAGYDALHAFLTPAERKTIADGMVRLSVLPLLGDWVLPGTRIHSFDSMGHNWWGVCVAGGGLCALALRDDEPRAQGWIDAVDAGFVEWFNYAGDVLHNRPPTFERDGPSYEGVNYTNYAISEYLRYRLAWQHTYPGREAAAMEPLNHVATFFVQTLYPTSNGCLSVNLEDSPPAIDATTAMLLLIACGLGTADSSRYLDYVHNESWNLFHALLRRHPRPPVTGELPTACIYPRMGWAILRSSWDRDTTLLAMKSGYTWNHAHADAGSFILMTRGRPLIIDSGTSPYYRREYSTYYRQSRAHNVILFDGEGQPKDDINQGSKFPGQMHDLVDRHGLKYVYADATGPMARWFTRNYRHWLWSGDVILVIDDVRAHAPGQMDWLLHYNGEYAPHPAGGIILKNGPAEAVVRMLYPPHQHHEDTGLAEHEPDRKVPFLVFRPESAAQARHFLTVICTTPAAMPKLELLQGENYLGVRVETPDAVEETYLNLRSTATPGTIEARIGEWITDAYLLHVKQPHDRTTPPRYFVADGSYVRRGERSVFESLTKATACWVGASTNSLNGISSS